MGLGRDTHPVVQTDHINTAVVLTLVVDLDLVASTETFRLNCCVRHFETFNGRIVEFVPFAFVWVAHVAPSVGIHRK